MALVGSHLALPASQLSQLHARTQRRSYQAWKHLSLVQTTSSTFVNFVMREAACCCSCCWQTLRGPWRPRPFLVCSFVPFILLMHSSQSTKAILSSSDGGGEEQEHPLMQSLPMPIRPKSLRTTSMPHPSVSHDGSGATWQHEDKSSLSHIDEASPRHPMPEPSSNNSRTFELPDSGKADESATAHSSSPTVTYGHRPNHTWQAHSNAKPRLSFISYLAEEAIPYEKEPQKDIVWGQTERDRVYQYLILVPYQLERLLQLGFVICVDTLLGAITLLPLRCLFSVTALFRGSRKSSPMGSTIRDQLGGGRIFDLLTLLILVAVRDHLPWSLLLLLLLVLLLLWLRTAARIVVCGKYLR